MSIFEVFPDVEQCQHDGFAGLACAKPAIMIAMSPRTGSTHLCAALQLAGDFGRITEIFNPRGVAGAEKSRRGVQSFAGLIQSINEQPSSGFAFKTCWQDFAPFAPAFRTIFKQVQVVYLDRNDIISQAVSLFRAQISETWHRPKGQPPASGTDLASRFNRGRAEEIIAELQTEKRSWEQFFVAQAIIPARLFYESFASDVSQAVVSIAAQLHLDLRTDISPGLGYEKLADALSDEWVDALRRHVFRMT